MNQAAKHILVVDDDQKLRDLLTRYLGEQGFAVVGAADGAAMDVYLAHNSVDLVVLDLNLPQMDGWEVLNVLKDLPEVCLLSGWGKV